MSERKQLAPSLTVLILAGGQSSRMGSDKARLTWHGTPLLTHICQVAQVISEPVYVLSPWPERYADMIPENIGLLQESQIGRGPLLALQEGMHYCQTDWIFLLACDMPYLEPARINQWRSQLAQLSSSCLAYVPQTQHKSSPRWEPLCGFYRRVSLASLEQFLNQGGQSFQAWLTRIEAIAIPLQPDDITMLTNCNTPEDWSAIWSTPSPFEGETG